MLVVLALAAAVILAGAVAVAMGYGGEMAEFVPDVPPLTLPDADRLGAADFMALQLPVSLVGYHTQSVDETLDRVARALSERDTRIAVLEQRVTEMLSVRLQARQEVHVRPPEAPRTEHEPEGPGEPPGPPPVPPESFGAWEGERWAVPEAAEDEPLAVPEAAEDEPRAASEVVEGERQVAPEAADGERRPAPEAVEGA